MSSSLRLSVVVPVRDAEATLGDALRAIKASDLPRASYEIIVVDDGSTDASQAIGARFADTLIRLGAGPRGPAYARNRGAELARGDVVAFVDADVRVRADTFSRMLALLAQQPNVDAVSASYDDHPTAPGLVSQYWNLLLHLRAQRAAGMRGQFGAACGAVRRSTLHAVGMFNEWHHRNRLEDVELGYRLAELGHETTLIRGIQVTHLKRWTLADIVHEAWARSILFARCLNFERSRSEARSEMVQTLSSIGAFAVAMSAAVEPAPGWIITLMAAVVILLVTDRAMYGFFVRRRGLIFALATMPLHVATQLVNAAALCAGWALRHTIGDPSPDATTQAYAEVGVDVWPPVPRRR